MILIGPPSGYLYYIVIDPWWNAVFFPSHEARTSVMKRRPSRRDPSPRILRISYPMSMPTSLNICTT